jgi:ketosteroid isomerase-like protein
VSHENAEVVRRSTAAYNRGDVDGMLSSWAPDAVLDWSNSRGPEAGIYVGRDQIRAFTKEFIATWDEARIEIEDPVEIEGDALLVENVTYLRGRDGIRTQARSVWLITFRDGQQTSLTLYQTREEARKAAGLRQ